MGEARAFGFSHNGHPPLSTTSIFARVPEYAALCTVFNKLLPAFIGQATVVFTMMHVFCYVGMYIFGGRITPADPMWAERDFAANLYYLLNFNTYKEGMVTLFMLLVR